MRHVVAALARRGVAAIAPDLNGAFTIGFEADRHSHLQRWSRIVDTTLSALGAAGNGNGPNFGVSLVGRLELGRIGVLGHSLSGADAVHYAQTHQISALLLLAPVFADIPLPLAPVAVVGSGCDNDVPGQGRLYLDMARAHVRPEPVFYVHLGGANHTFYNSRLPTRDGGRQRGAAKGCKASQRLTPRRQRTWLDRFAGTFFATSLLGAPAPDWMRFDLPPPSRIYGLRIGYDRIEPGPG